MSSSFAVEPRPGSFVAEWVAVYWGGPNDFPSLKRLLAKTGWLIQTDLNTNSAVLTKSHGSSLEQWTLSPGYYCVRSPHDKIWVMDAQQFSGEFQNV